MFVPPAISQPATPARRLGLSALVGLAVMAAVLCFFCPRFYRFYLVPPVGLAGASEDIRAQAVLQQLHDPFVAVPGFANRVVQWRLLFPVLGHFLRLPDPVFLALPFVAAWLLLAWVFNGCWLRTDSKAAAYWITLLVGTCSWFFVSTGWLGYYDSWLILALLLYTFSPSLRLRLVVCLLIPWVDERFLFEMPLLAMVRHVYLGRAPETWRMALREFLFELLAFSPYLVLRGGGMLLGRDPESGNHISAVLHLTRYPAMILRGLWEGLRTGWLVIAAAIWIKRRQVRVLLLLGVLTLAALVVNNFLALDVSRSTSVFVPLVVMAALVVQRVQRGTLLLAVLAAGNLFLPASHVVDGLLIERIRPVWLEASRANLLAFDARIALNEHRIDDAMALFKQAVAADPGFISAHRGLAAAYMAKQNYPQARRELVIVTTSPEGFGTDWIQRGMCEFASGQLAEAKLSLTKGIMDRDGSDDALKQVAATLLQRMESPPAKP